MNADNQQMGQIQGQVTGAEVSWRTRVRVHGGLSLCLLRAVPACDNEKVEAERQGLKAFAHLRDSGGRTGAGCRRNLILFIFA